MSQVTTTKKINLDQLGHEISVDSGYIYHTFTSSSIFSNFTSCTCDILVIAGGGGNGGSTTGTAGARGIIIVRYTYP